MCEAETSNHRGQGLLILFLSAIFPLPQSPTIPILKSAIHLPNLAKSLIHCNTIQHTPPQDGLYRTSTAPRSSEGGDGITSSSEIGSSDEDIPTVRQ